MLQNYEWQEQEYFIIGKESLLAKVSCIQKIRITRSELYEGHNIHTLELLSFQMTSSSMYIPSIVRKDIWNPRPDEFLLATKSIQMFLECPVNITGPSELWQVS